MKLHGSNSAPARPAAPDRPRSAHGRSGCGRRWGRPEKRAAAVARSSHASRLRRRWRNRAERVGKLSTAQVGLHVALPTEYVCTGAREHGTESNRLQRQPAPAVAPAPPPPQHLACALQQRQHLGPGKRACLGPACEGVVGSQEHLRRQRGSHGGICVGSMPAEADNLGRRGGSGVSLRSGSPCSRMCSGHHPRGRGSPARRPWPASAAGRGAGSPRCAAAMWGGPPAPQQTAGQGGNGSRAVTRL
jgi:hypothetical protein